MTQLELNEIIRLHKLWLKCDKNGIRAELSNADLSESNLSGSNLSGAKLSWANLSWANLSGANLSGANLLGSNLSWANLSGANLSGANLSWANLSWANLSGAKGLINPAQWMNDNFETNQDGYIVYKSFDETYNHPESWKIEPGAFIEEVVNQLPTLDCACGVNFGTKDWVKRNCSKQVYECLIEWRDAVGITVPYNTDGKARCGRIKIVKEAEL